MAATVIHLEAARSALAMAEAVVRYAEVNAQLKALETEAKALRLDIFSALDANESDAVEVGGYKVTRSARRSLKQEVAVAVLDEAGLADCVITTRQADPKAAEAAVTLGLLDAGTWAECFTTTPVLTLKAH